MGSRGDLFTSWCVHHAAPRPNIFKLERKYVDDDVCGTGCDWVGSWFKEGTQRFRIPRQDSQAEKSGLCVLGHAGGWGRTGIEWTWKTMNTDMNRWIAETNA